MDKQVTTFRNRLSELLSIYDLSASDFSRRTGLNKSVISLYLNGKREPMQCNIVAIAQSFDIDPAWLMGFDVPMKIKESALDKYNIENARLLNIVKNNEQVREFLSSFLELSEPNQKLVTTLVDTLLGNQEANR